MELNLTEIGPNSPYKIGSLWTVGSSGEKVNLETALQLPAFNSCLQTISESVSMLPFKFYNSFNGKTKVADWTNEYMLFSSEVTDYMNASTFKKVMTATYMLYGDSVAEIEYAANGKILHLHYIEPSKLQQIEVYKNKLIYTIDGKTFKQNKIFHLMGLNYNPCGFRGTGILEIGKETIALALAQNRYATSFFQNGATPATIILTKDEMPKETKENFLTNWNRMFKGAKNQNKTAVLGPAVQEVKTIGSDAEKSQLLESRKESIIEICRLFRIAPHLAQSLERATFSNIEEQAQGFIDYTLMPHIINWEQSCNRQLVNPADKGRFYFKFNLGSLERGKLLERYQAHSLAINAGWKNRNEVRELEDLDRGPNELDEFVRLGNLVKEEQNGNKK